MDWLKNLIEAVTTKIETKTILGYGEVVVHPDGYMVTKVEPDAEKPRRIEQKLTFWNVEGWLAYVAKWANPDMLVMASPIRLGGPCEQPLQRIVAIFDYHADRENPDWCRHQAVLNVCYGPQIMNWIKISGQWLDQERFALFIEERAGDISEPPAATMAGIALNVEATIGGRVEAKRDLNNTSSFKLVTDNQTIPTIEIPRNLTAYMPLFAGGREHMIKTLLRYNLKDGVKFQILMPGLQAAVIRAIDEQINEIEDKINGKVMGGDLTI